MKTRYGVTLNGVALDSLADSICILDLCEQTPAMRRIVQENDWRDGRRILRTVRTSLTVTVSFAIR